MMRKFLILALWCFVAIQPLVAQDVDYVRTTIDSLCSDRFHGRGYVANGDSMAAAFLAGQLKHLGVEPIDGQYFQSFTLSMNTFPGNLTLKMGKTRLSPAEDFLISADSPPLKGKFKTVWLDKNNIISGNVLVKNVEGTTQTIPLSKLGIDNKVVIVDTGYDGSLQELYASKAIISIVDHPLSWGIYEGKKPSRNPLYYVSREKLPADLSKVEIEVESVFKRAYQTSNVMGVIKGAVQPDSFIVFTAHYDHLGMMGAEVMYPGANDNASGCAMLLDLAKHYMLEENRPDYSVVFLFFAGEEAGLRGSNHYVENPSIPLKNIRFLLNLDMVSTGSDGIKVVNGPKFIPEFDRLVKLNDSLKLLKTVSPRGESKNSDHYPFYAKEVRCFFIYTLGNEWKEYHTPGDKAEGLPLTAYKEMFRLITAWAKELMN